MSKQGVVSFRPIALRWQNVDFFSAGVWLLWSVGRPFLRQWDSVKLAHLGLGEGCVFVVINGLGDCLMNLFFILLGDCVA